MIMSNKLFGFLVGCWWCGKKIEALKIRQMLNNKSKVIFCADIHAVGAVNVFVTLLAERLRSVSSCCRVTASCVASQAAQLSRLEEGLARNVVERLQSEAALRSTAAALEQELELQREEHSSEVQSVRRPHSSLLKHRHHNARLFLRFVFTMKHKTRTQAAIQLFLFLSSTSAYSLFFLTHGFSFHCVINETSI